MRIPLDDLSTEHWRPRYVGGSPRYSTASAVRLLGPDRLICNHYLGKRLYLIGFDLKNERYRVLDRVDTVYAGRKVTTDLLATDGEGRVVTSNLDVGSMSLYDIVGDRIRFGTSLDLGLEGNFCHGAEFYGSDVVVTTTLRAPRGAHFFARKTRQSLLHVKTDLRCKDISFLSESRAVMVVTSSRPATHATPSTPTKNALIEASIDLPRARGAVLRDLLCPEAVQFDSCVAHDGRLFVADSGRGVFVFDARTLRRLDLLKGYAFPHGVDANYGMLAVACYGDNAVHLRAL